MRAVRHEARLRDLARWTACAGGVFALRDGAVGAAFRVSWGAERLGGVIENVLHHAPFRGCVLQALFPASMHGELGPRPLLTLKAWPPFEKPRWSDALGALVGRGGEFEVRRAAAWSGALDAFDRAVTILEDQIAPSLEVGLEAQESPAELEAYLSELLEHRVEGPWVGTRKGLMGPGGEVRPVVSLEIGPGISSGALDAYVRAGSLPALALAVVGSPSSTGARVRAFGFPADPAPAALRELRGELHDLGFYVGPERPLALAALFDAAPLGTMARLEGLLAGRSSLVTLEGEG